MVDNEKRPFRVLCLDSGGMRGLYTDALLDTLIKRERSNEIVDAGKAFDLIVGTSTGGILAMGLAYGLPLQDIVDLYRQQGANIFPNPTPSQNGSGKGRKIQHRAGHKR